MLVTEVAKAIALKEAEPTTQNDSSTQTEAKPTTRSDISTQVAPRTDETAVQTNANPEHWCPVIQTELPNGDNALCQLQYPNYCIPSSKTVPSTLRTMAHTAESTYSTPPNYPAPRITL
jgi:hypothetical protein